jgi:hypothetical protein
MNRPEPSNSPNFSQRRLTGHFRKGAVNRLEDFVASHDAHSVCSLILAHISSSNIFSSEKATRRAINLSPLSLLAKIVASSATGKERCRMFQRPVWERLGIASSGIDWPLGPDASSNTPQKEAKDKVKKFSSRNLCTSEAALR